MQRVLGIKSVVAIVVAIFLLSVGITTAQTQSIPLEQKTPVTPVSRLMAIKYQGTSDRKDGRRIAPTTGTDCLFGAEHRLIALMPANNLALTSSERTKLFFYIPKTPKTSVQALEFVLMDATGQILYKQIFKVNNKPGIFSLSLPVNSKKPLLKIGEEYEWFFSAICNLSRRYSNIIITRGWLKQIVSNENLTTELNNASPRDRAAIYAARGIWSDSLATLALARQKRPDDLQLKNDWQSLLESVDLAKIAQEPLIGELKAE